MGMAQKCEAPCFRGSPSNVMPKHEFNRHNNSIADIFEGHGNDNPSTILYSSRKTTICTLAGAGNVVRDLGLLLGTER